MLYLESINNIKISYSFTSLCRNFSHDFSKKTLKDFGSMGIPTFFKFFIGNI